MWKKRTMQTEPGSGVVIIVMLFLYSNFFPTSAYKDNVCFWIYPLQVILLQCSCLLSNMEISPKCFLHQDHTGDLTLNLCFSKMPWSFRVEQEFVDTETVSLPSGKVEKKETTLTLHFHLASLNPYFSEQVVFNPVCLEENDKTTTFQEMFRRY